MLILLQLFCIFYTRDFQFVSFFFVFSINRRFFTIILNISEVFLAFHQMPSASRSTRKIHNWALQHAYRDFFILHFTVIWFWSKREHPPHWCGGCSLQPSAACSNTQMRAIGQRASISKVPFDTLTVSNPCIRVKMKCRDNWRIHATFYANFHKFYSESNFVLSAA